MLFFMIFRCDIRHLPIGLGNHAPASGIQRLISTEYIGTNMEPQVHMFLLRNQIALRTTVIGCSPEIN